MDVVILGGGIVGLTMANLLAQTDLQITLVESNLPILDWDDNQYDVRCSAITPKAKSIFKQLHVWDQISAQRLAYYDQMLVWDQEIHNQISFAAHDINQLHLGYIIENRVIAKALYLQLQQYKNITVLAKVMDEQIFSELRKPAQLIIGADGANSWLRKHLKMPSVQHDYKHSALVATIASEYPHTNIAMQRFMPDGPLAFLPLMDSNLCSIVWSSDPQRINNLMQIEEHDFCSQLAAEFAFKLGALKLHGQRASFPLRMMHTTQYILPGVALIGDAAHVIHPLAGQGLNLGILDAAALAATIEGALVKRQNIGALNVLRKYERQRKAHNMTMLALMGGIKGMFANKHPVLSSMRMRGMQILNHVDFAKNVMMRYAAGLD